jgi:LAO/AO transport system kinase
MTGTAAEAALQALAEQAIAGDRRALARLLSWLEARPPEAEAANSLLYAHAHRRTPRAHLVGITGAPGTGKSTLVAALARTLRAQGETVAVLAVDPSSPYTGGAILGDRVRMTGLHADTGVFIRSMAARGVPGGLAPAARDCARALAACGFSFVLIETVGAGQNEVAVAGVAETVVVVEAPGLGDDVQAIKAGILETADVLVVNKADKPGAKATVAALREMLELGHPVRRRRAAAGHHGAAALPAGEAHAPETPDWFPPIIETVANAADAAGEEGIAALLAALRAHRAHRAAHPAEHESADILDEIREHVAALAWASARARLSDTAWQRLVARAAAGTLSPAGAAREAFAALFAPDASSAQPEAE